MADIETVEITNELLIRGMSAAGGWKAAQFDIIGVKWPPRHGWKLRVIGNRIAKSQAEKFVALRGSGFAAEPIPTLFGERSKTAKIRERKVLAKGLDHPAIRLLAEKPGANWWLLRFDGSCSENGKSEATGGWGFHIQDATYHTMKEGHGRTHAAVVTNNVSEWTGLAEGLTAVGYVEVPTAAGLLIEGDSMLVIQTLTGRWASKKPELTALRDECRDRLKVLGVPWFARWIPREENEYCDAMT